LVIDHCHRTGLLRSIIDWKVNKGLAFFDDNSDWLRAAADHLDNPSFPRALGENVYGVQGRVGTKKGAASRRVYGPDRTKTPQPRTFQTKKKETIVDH
jgi:hypothetical protein